MTTEAALLRAMTELLNKQVLLVMDEATIRDMLKRYPMPPFTMHSRAVIRMNVTTLQQLRRLLKMANAHLQAEEKAGAA